MNFEQYRNKVYKDLKLLEKYIYQNMIKNF